MSDRSVFRLTAVGLMIGAVLFAVGVPQAAPPPEVTVIPQLLVIGFGMLLMVGVAGLYARQHQEVGILGLVGAAVIFFSTFLLTSFNFLGAFVVPVLAEGAPEFLQRFPEGEWGRLLALNIGTHVSFAVGWLLFGIATYRAAVLPRWASVAALVGGILQVGYQAMPRPVGVAVILLLALGMFGLGRGLWASVGEADGAFATRKRVAGTS